MFNKTVPVPGPIAIALMTGRPELARAGMETTLAATKGTELEPIANDLIEFAAGCVRDIQGEREVLGRLGPALKDAWRNLDGALNSIERLETAVDMMLANADPETIEEALKSNSERTRERKAERIAAEGPRR